jgi:hypothetical protein
MPVLDSAVVEVGALLWRAHHKVMLIARALA